MDWESLLSASEEQIRKNLKNINQYDWYHISLASNLSETFIREYADYIFWFELHKSVYSIEFIRQYKHTLNWTILSAYYIFTPEQLEEFRDYIDWYKVSRNQKLTPEFIERYKQELYIEQILLNPNMNFDKIFKKHLIALMNGAL